MNSPGKTEKQEPSSLDLKLSLLQQLPFFKDTPLETCRLFAYLSKIKYYEADAPVIIQGEPCDRMFIILSGNISICKSHHERNFHLQTLTSRGINYFGELALLAEFDWFFSARTQSKATLMTVTREAFRKVMEKHPEQLPQTMSHIIRLRIDRFIDQTHYLLDYQEKDAWRECDLKE